MATLKVEGILRSSLICVSVLGTAVGHASVSSIAKVAARGEAYDAASQYDAERASIQSESKLLRRMCESAPKVAAVFERDAAETHTNIDAFVWPAEQYHWSSLSQSLTRARSFLARVSGRHLLVDCGIGTPNVTKLFESLSALTTRVIASAPQLLQAHLHEKKSIAEFLSSYPVALDGPEFLKQNVEAILASARGIEPVAIASQLVALGTAIDESKRAALVKVLFDRSLHAPAMERSPALKVADSLLILELSKKMAGLDALEVPAVLAIEPRKVSEGGCEPFPIEGWLGPTKSSEIATHLSKIPSRHIVVMSCEFDGFERRASPVVDVRSQAVVGTKQEPNPDRYPAQLEVERLQAQLQSERASQSVNNAIFGSNLGKSLGQGLALSVIESRLRTAQERMAQIPAFVTLPILGEYTYRKIDTKHVKNGVLTVASISREDNQAHVWRIPIKQTLELTELYDVKANEYSEQLIQQSKEWQPELEQFRRETLAPDLNRLLPVIEKGKRKVIEISAVAGLFQRAEPNAMTAGASTRTKATVAARDKRMETVVVVTTPIGFGTGFFIAPAYVVTNAHVVEKTPFVEVRNGLGQTSSAEVIAIDARRDLALLKTNLSGRIASLGIGEVTPAGATIDVMGHPEGLEFSVLRGVISAVRAMPSKRDPGAAKVLFIQTDAAINSGNSGGPVFFGDTVIGVATSRLVAVDVAGLNFAVHVQELAGFLASAGIQID